jgi:hypothetical protein
MEACVFKMDLEEITPEDTLQMTLNGPGWSPVARFFERIYDPSHVIKS